MAKNNPMNKRSASQASEIELVDFTNDPWSWKGKAPIYPITPEGFTFDIEDENGLDRKAISLGILGMIIIVFNAKSATIREEEVLPIFFDVIATRSWLTIPKKEAGALAKTAIAKLTDGDSSGDVFDLCSFAPLEVKRSLLRSLFAVARLKLKPEFKQEAENRILGDIVPNIFDDPAFELATLTGNIIREKVEEEKRQEPTLSVEPEETYEPSAEEEPDIVTRVQASEIHQDAEVALRAHLEQLTKAVPDLPPLPPEPIEDDYVPFSDMEADEEFSARMAQKRFLKTSGKPQTSAPEKYEAPVEKIPDMPRSASPETPESRSQPNDYDVAASLYAQSGYPSENEYQLPTGSAFSQPPIPSGYQGFPPGKDVHKQPPIPESFPDAGQSSSPQPNFPSQFAAPGRPDFTPFGQVPNFGPAPAFGSNPTSQYPPRQETAQPGKIPPFPPAPNFGQAPNFAQPPNVGPAPNFAQPRSDYSGQVPPAPFPSHYRTQSGYPPYGQAAAYPPYPPQPQPSSGLSPSGYPQPGAFVQPPDYPIKPPDDDMESTAPRKAV